MTIQKKQLVESLKACMPGIESGSAVLQGADSFVFHDGKIFSYNDAISVTVPITQEGLLEEGIEGCVKAEEFFKVVSKFPADEIKFTVTEKGSWLLKCGKAKAEMTLLNFDFERLAYKVNIKSNQSNIASIVEAIVKRKVFVYALSRGEEVRLRKLFLNLRQVNKLPAKEEVVIKEK